MSHKLDRTPPHQPYLMNLCGICDKQSSVKMSHKLDMTRAETNRPSRLFMQRRWRIFSKRRNQLGMLARAAVLAIAVN